MPDDQVTLFDFLPTENADPSPTASISAAELIAMGNAKDTFGCCSHYRECSEAGHCVIPDRDYSINCTYRRNLERGQIFYGKNSIFLDEAKYKIYLDRINALSPEAKKAFDDLILVFAEYNRATSMFVVRNQYIDELAAVGLFDFRPLGSIFSPMCAYRTLLSIIQQEAEYPFFCAAQKVRTQEIASLKSALKCAKEQDDKAEIQRLQDELKLLPGKRTHEFLSWWLNNEGADLRNRLAAPYRLAERNQGAIDYIAEYYHDHLLAGYDDRIYSLSPMAADRLVPDGDLLTEEIRRVKLSHGYSPEEKSRRLALLDEIQATKNTDEKERLSLSYNF